MKTKDLITIASVALGTATLTVGVFCAGPIEAGGEPEALAPKIENPKFMARGVQFTLRAAGDRVFKTGEQPEFELTAVNKNAEAASVLLLASMSASSPRDEMSRVIRLPAMMWHQQQLVELKGKETKTFTLTATTNLPPNSVMSVWLQESDPNKPASAAPQRFPSGIVALSFSTVVPRQGTPAFAVLDTLSVLPSPAAAPQQTATQSSESRL